ncbi:ABC transporter permease [Kineosporia succinea]|uniref:Peptide/nickel transport system permease protein n=1 Tax=Kineosporia succinea TaxID=84632 RepID=A0ABT9P7B9_9ACTN|nr:ABC transporter permease [Kineosporia succinea]MDP9828563.1 peptide/nickel transport system permease protein [Kineosporia succinea]
MTRNPATRTIALRLLTVPLVLWALATLVFVALRFLPGSPATSLAAGGASDQSAEQITANADQISESLGLSQPLPVQYLTYLGDLIRGDFGSSYFGGNDVLSLLRSALPATIELTVAAMLAAVVIGGVSGLVAALRKDTPVDTGIRAAATVTFSLPWFALGVLGIVVFGVWLGWLPVLGRLPNRLEYEPLTNFVLLDAVLQDRPELIWPWIQHLILPAATLALSTAGFITRIVRASVLEVLGDDFVRTAQMKGLGEGQVVRKHVLRNASLPIITVLGLQFGTLLGGSTVTETVFSYPGVGVLLVDAVLQRDYPVVQGAALAIALLFVLVNAAVDVLYLVLDPRLGKS